MSTVFIIVAAVLAIALVVALVWFIRARTFRPTKNKRRQLKRLNKVLESKGFAYEPNGDYFYSLINCWQRKTGYCRLYDEAAPFFNMIMDCEPVQFEYKGKRWLIEMWKGQYGITTGCEIGIYNTSREDIVSEKFTGPFYEAIREDEMLDLSYTLKRKGETLLQRQARHWWLTGFALGTFSQPEDLTLEGRIVFPERAMRNAFLQALRSLGYQPHEFQADDLTVVVHFTKPHAKQPASQTGLQRQIAQDLNKSNCELYQTVTTPYTDTLDRLELLTRMAPNLFDFLLNSLYAKAFFEAFEWLLPEPTQPSPPKPGKPQKPICDFCPPKPAKPPKRPGECCSYGLPCSERCYDPCKLYDPCDYCDPCDVCVPKHHRYQDRCQ